MLIKLYLFFALFAGIVTYISLKAVEWFTD